MCKYSLHSLSHDVKKNEGVVATLIEFIVKTLKIISLTPEKSSHLMNEWFQAKVSEMICLPSTTTIIRHCASMMRGRKLWRRHTVAARSHSLPELGGSPPALSHGAVLPVAAHRATTHNAGSCGTT